MYDYLQTLDSPKRVLDLGAWNGRWTNAVKKFWPDAHYTCIEAGQKRLLVLMQLTILLNKMYKGQNF